MNQQRKLIHETKWDLLIILDACRADIFQEIYPEFLDGVYQTVISPEIPTPEWVAYCFPRKYDIIYCSGNPYINEVWRHPVTGYLAIEHFLSVDHVFDWGWEKVKNIETVPPWSINRSIYANIDFGYPLIGHYMQPHPPYIGETSLDIGSFHHARNVVLKTSSRGRPFGVKEYRDARLIRAYKDNLRLVLDYVSIFAEEDLDIIITADHGELLGEYSDFGHAKKVPEVTHVPWLIL